MLSLAWRNLWCNRRRTIITLTALALSTMLVQGTHNLSFGVYQRMIDSGVRAGSGHLAVYQAGYLETRDEKLNFAPEGLVREIAATDGVAAALPRVLLPGLAQSSRDSRSIILTGVDAEAEVGINPFLKEFSKPELTQMLQGRGAVIGAKLLKELQLEPGQKFVVTVQRSDGVLGSELFRVRGVVKTGLKEIDGSLVLVRRDKAATLGDLGGRIHELAIVLESAGTSHQLQPLLAALLKERQGLNLVTWEESMSNLANAIKLDYASQKFIFLLLLVIVTIGVINTQLMSVMERFREFGVMLALGATPGRLRSLILFESLLLGVCGVILGTILGSLLTWYLVDVGIDLRSFISGDLEFGGVIFDPIMRAMWDYAWMGQIGCYVVLLALWAALYPAYKAGKISPVRAMRHT